MSARLGFSLTLALGLGGCTLIDLSGLDGSGGAGSGVTTSTPDVTTGTGCSAPLTQCDTECVDLTLHPNHCGACGHDCETGECKESVCQPALVWIGAQGPDFRATGVVLTDNDVVWMAHEGALTMPKSGGDVRTISPNASARLLVRDGFLYQARDSIVKTDLATSEIVDTFDVPCDFDLAFGPGEEIYCSNFSGQLWHVDMSDGSNTMVAGSDAKAIVSDDTFIYWGQGGIGLARKTHGLDDATTIFSDDQVNGGLALGNGGVYFVGDFLWRVDTGTLESEKLSPGNDGGGLTAVDSKSVWFTLWDTGFVRTLDFAGDTDMTFTTGAKGVDVIALDDRYVFFTDNVGNALYRIVR